MSLALMRDLAEAGIRVAAAGTKSPAGGLPLGFSSRAASETVLLPEEEYENALYDFCASLFEREGKRPALLPVGAATLSLLSREEVRERFSATCGLCIPAEETLRLLNDKTRAAKLAAELSVPLPRAFEPEPGEEIFSFAARISYPCVVKPPFGERLGLPAARRYRIARTEAEFLASYEHFSRIAGEAPLVQEFLTGGGFGCSVLANEGRIVTLICHRRVRELPVTGGPSTCCETVSYPLLEEYAERITGACRYTGPVMFEFKEDADGNPRFLEANPRLWGTYPLTRAANTGFSLSWFTLAWNEGNPDTPLPLPARAQPGKVRMRFFPSDLAAGLGYLRRGEAGRTAGMLWDLINPNVCDGLFEMRDLRPGIAYLRSFLQRNRYKG